MAEAVESRSMKFQTVSGAFLILLPVGVSWYWGNISVYILSYILDCTSLDRGIEAPWILSLMRVFWTLGILLHAPLTRRIERQHATVLIGIFMFNIGIFLTYLSTKISVVLTTICMGAIVGLGKGLLEGATLKFVLDWSVKDAVILRSFVLCAIPAGAIVISQIATLHVNPLNLPPDITVGHMMFFSQRDVLDQVPSMFIILGIASSIVQTIGLLMLRESDLDTCKSVEKPKTYGSVSIDHQNIATRIHPTKDIINDSKKDSQSDEKSHDLTLDGPDKAKDCNNISSHPRKTVESETSENENSLIEQDNSQDVTGDTNIPNGYDYMSPELLGSCAFYATTLAYLCGDTSFIVFKNYYKSYGQQSIKDDHFLAEAVILLCLIAIFVKIVWIFIMDGIGHITCMICQFALMAVLTICVYLSPMLNKWMYLFLYSVFNAVACSYDEVFTAISFKQFGKNIFNTNFGLVTTFSIGVHLATAIVLQELLNQLGWFSIFAYSASLNFLGMILLTVYYFKTSRCWSPGH